MNDGPLLAGKVAVVSGGSRGIGRAIVLALAAEGADVAFSYHKEARAAKDVVGAVERLGRRVYATPSDASVAAEAEEFVQKAKARLGRIDIVVANAGIPGPGGWEAISEASWREILATNVAGPYALVVAARRLFPAAGANVVLVSSTAGLRAYPEQPAYAASKAGVVTMTKSLARALAPGIRVNVVLPGFVRTRFAGWPQEAFDSAEKITPLRALATVEDIADAALFFAVSAKATTGASLVVDGGMSTIGASL